MIDGIPNSRLFILTYLSSLDDKRKGGSDAHSQNKTGTQDPHDCGLVKNDISLFFDGYVDIAFVLMCAIGKRG